jgi:hypothetical protein
MSSKELVEKIEARIAGLRDELACWGSSATACGLLTSEIAFLETILATIKTSE